MKSALLLSTFAAGLLAIFFAGGSPATIVPATDAALPLPEKDLQYEEGVTEATVVVAGGCFWCTEAVFEKIRGVTQVVPGYSGGTRETATYDDVARGRSTHAESIQITFDPTEVSFAKIMQIFFTMHDPTQLNQQTPDIGKQYRSAVFFANESEREIVAAYIKQLDESGALDKPVATTLEPLEIFFPAEDYHQDYVQHNPRDGYVVQWALPKLAKVEKLFPDDLKRSGEANENKGKGSGRGKEGNRGSGSSKK